MGINVKYCPSCREANAYTPMDNKCPTCQSDMVDSSLLVVPLTIT